MGWQSVVAQLHRLSTRKGREQVGAYSIEGIRLVERAWRAGAPLRRVVVAAGAALDPAPRLQRLLADLAAAGVDLETVPDEAMAGLTQGRRLGDIMGLLPLPPAPDLAALAAGTGPPAAGTGPPAAGTGPPAAGTGPPAAGMGPLFLVAVDVVDPGNVGALVRTAHAAGATALLATGVSDPFHPRAVRTSRGSLFRLPVGYFDTAPALVAQLRGLAVTLVGATVAAGVSLPQAAFPPTGLAVLLGNEYRGLPAALLPALDLMVTIPMAAGVDSFAVNAAAAVLLYEIQRQRAGGTG